MKPVTYSCGWKPPGSQTNVSQLSERIIHSLCVLAHRISSQPPFKLCWSIFRGNLTRLSQAPFVPEGAQRSP